MASLPPNLVGPVLQSHLAQWQVSRLRDAESAQEATAQRQQAHVVDEQSSIVETTDNDTQVYADAEGTGSQGRPFTGAPPDETAEPEEPTPPTDNEGTHIDLEA